MGSREEFLQRVRDAVRAGNQVNPPTEMRPRGSRGYQGAGPDAVERFCAEFTVAGGVPHRVRDRTAALDKLVELVKVRSPRRVLIGNLAVLDLPQLCDRLKGIDVEPVAFAAIEAGQRRQQFFAADLSITGAAALVAETGSIVVMSGPDEPRSLSLLPPVHLVVAERNQVVEDLFDLFARFEAAPANGGPAQRLPSGLTLITGPSKTGDIELKLVTGVHGPGEVHVVLIA